MKKIFALLFSVYIASAPAQTYMEGTVVYGGDIKMKEGSKRSFSIRMICLPFNETNYTSALAFENSHDTLKEWCYADSDYTFLNITGSDTVYTYALRKVKNFSPVNSNERELKNYQETDEVMMLPLEYKND